jgi:hypothetical protein
VRVVLTFPFLGRYPARLIALGFRRARIQD